MKGAMLKVRSLLIAFTVLGLSLTACGGGEGVPGPGGVGDLEGQWISQGVNASGERARLTFLANDTFKIEAYKRTSTQLLTAALDSGKYQVKGQTITFNFDAADSVSSLLQFVTANHIMIDEKTYFRADPDGTMAGGAISGQIRIDDGSGAASASVGGMSAIQTAGFQALSTSADAPKPSQPAQPQVKVKTSYIRDHAVIVRRHKVTRKVERKLLRGTNQQVQAIKEAKNVTDRIQALSVMQGSLSERVDEELADCPPDHGCYLQTKFLNVMRAQAVAVPNDPSYDRQWGMRSVNAPGAWVIVDNVTPEEHSVAVIDSGKKFNSDFELPNLLFGSGWDFISDPDAAGDNDQRDDDPEDEGDDYFGAGQHSYHGTHVSGIIAATRDNNDGVVGVSKQGAAKIEHLRVIGADGDGTLPDIADAILYAAGEIDSAGNQTLNGTPRAKVINLSLGCVLIKDGESPPANAPHCNQAALDNGGITGAIQAALDDDIIVVAAAGNCPSYPSGCNLPFHPASQQGVIKVGGITSAGVFASLSHFGTDQFMVAPSGSLEPCNPNLAADTTQVFSAVYNGFACRAGTSQAAPFVTGAINLMLAVNKNLTPEQIKNILQTTAFDLGPTGKDDKYGHGLLNVGAAVEEAYALGGGNIDNLAGVPAAALLVSQTELNYKQVKNSNTVFLHKVGKGSLTGLTANSPDSWIKDLKLSATTAPATLTIEVDRAGLAAGQYDTKVTVDSSNGTEEIQVSISVPEQPSTPSGSDGGGDTGGTNDGTGSGSGTGGAPNTFEEWLQEVADAFGPPGYKNITDIGEIIVLLIHVADNTVYAGIRTDFTANYQFEFGAVPDGEYYILAGQLNNAGQVCDITNTPNVPCTAYPSYDKPQILKVQGAIAITDAFFFL